MYCEQCGGALDPASGFCPACVRPAMAYPTSPAAPAAPPPPPLIAAQVKAASKDATQAFRTFAINPVGGLPVAFAGLGASRAMGVGIVFAVCSILCAFVGYYLALTIKPDIGTSLQFMVFGAVPFVSILAASAATRKVFRGAGSFGGDSLIAGAALLPFGFYALLSGLLGPANAEIAGLLLVFALCYGILMLYTGVTRISKVSESRAAFAVPVMIIVGVWLTKILFNALLSSLPSPARLLPFGN